MTPRSPAGFATALELRSDDAGAHLRWSITVLTRRGQHIAELTPFIGSDHVVGFGLPASLP
jgi:RNA polymerase sigma-70 factor (ECF subfamily)